MSKVSAYLSVFDDWAMLNASIASLEPFIDELVVVDGAYEWMLPYFQKSGRDPTTSDSRTWDALQPFSGKIRRVKGIWRTEEEKRAAGFAACQGRWVIRADADEIMHFDAHEFSNWTSSSYPIAQASVPIHIAPGLIRGTPGQDIERLCAFFDASRISAELHTHYLWLIESKERSSPSAHYNPSLIYPLPLSYLAHLTMWRPPETSVGRARFYVMNYLRLTGASIPSVPDFAYDDATGFRKLFELISPEQFDEILLTHPIVAAPPALNGAQVMPSPLSPSTESRFTWLYDQFLSGLAALNGQLTSRARTLGAGELACIDLTADALLPNNGFSPLVFQFSHPIHTVVVSVEYLMREPPFQVQRSVHHVVDGSRLTLTLDGSEEHPSTWLRRCLRLVVFPPTGIARTAMMLEKQAHVP